MSSNPECSKCGGTPCMCAMIAKARKSGQKHCESCGTELGLRGGYAGLDMCGPCTTGEAATLEEFGEEW